MLEVVDTNDEVSAVRKRTFRLIKTGLTLGFILVFFNLLRSELISLINFFLEGLSISGDLVLGVITLLFVIYFGYFILTDLKYFLDLASKRFGQKNRGNLQNITYDVVGLISLVLSSFLLTPIASSIQNVGETMAKAVNIVLLAIGFFLFYHLVNQIYSLLKQEIEKLIVETKQLKNSHKIN
jgi:hypothetical protein